MIVLDERDKRPIYEQIVDKLADLMARKVMKENEPVPSVRSLAMQLSINPNTVAKAYAELERRGYLYTVKGRGSFVAGNDSVRHDRQNVLKEELRQLCTRARAVELKAEEMIDIIRKELS